MTIAASQNTAVSRHSGVTAMASGQGRTTGEPDSPQPAFASLLDTGHDTLMEPQATLGAQSPLESVAPPTQAFDALGLLGRAHSVAFGDVLPDATGQAQAALADPAEVPVPGSSQAVSSSGVLATPKPTVPTLDLPGHAILPLVRNRPTGGPLLYRLFPAAAQTLSETGDVEEDRSTNARLDPRRMPFERPEPSPVSLMVAGAGQSVQIVARGCADDTSQRDTLRRLADQVAGEFGVSIESLQLDGSPVASTPFVIGDHHGR